MFRFAVLVALLACVASLQSVLATPYFTAPVAATTANGGSKLQVKWTDNGKSPTYDAKNWGNATLWLAAGSENTQYKLQTIKANFAPSRKSVSFTVDKTIGPSGQYYFIRMEGTDTGSNGYPVMSFSARFTLNGMSGQFNSTVLQAAMGQEGSASGSSSAMSTAVTRTSAATNTATAASSSTTTSKSSAAGRLSSNNNFVAVMGAGVLAFIGFAAAL
jgi:hypothetical protein